MQNNRVTITILPENRSVKVPAGTTIADALLNCNIVLHTPCGGKGICKKCTVHASGLLSQPDDYEKSLGDSSLRLACRAVIIGDATIWIDSITQRPRYPELNPTNTYAVAIDIGTTTVQIAFFDMTTKQAMPEITLLNPQRRFGQDVMTRISNANDHAKASHLTQILLQTIITTIQDICNISGIDIHSIVTIAISGNTVMSYSFLGIDITPLGTYPYTTLITSFDDYNHYPPLKKTFPNAQVTVLPAVSAFLGGDFLGGVGTLPKTKGNSFFFDIGTNGEMAIIKEDGTIVATSCAMGPALEGMNISSGMTATEGAITHFNLDNNTLTYTSIGDGKPSGISGTALIDLIAILLRNGVIEKSGAIKTAIPQPLSKHIQLEHIENIKTLIILDIITINQQDIRNVQLAKGASLAAAKILLREAGLSAHDIEQVYIAGAFGQHINIDNFNELSFLPEFKKATYHFSGNTSLKAAITACMDNEFLQRLIQRKKHITTIDLSQHHEFNDIYVKSLDF